MELDNVVVNHGAAVANWDLPGLGERFRLESMYLSPYDRAIYHRGDADFTPIMYYRSGHLPPALENFNVYVMTVSPPDEYGMCNFGDCQIMSKLLARKADLVIAEIDRKQIRVGGDNSIHISEIDYFVERTMELPEINLPVTSEEEARNIATVCQLVAKELIPDKSTIQIGVGSMSGMLCQHLHDHHDLGMQTEIIPLHTAPLVQEGVLTASALLIEISPSSCAISRISSVVLKSYSANFGLPSI
jgi:4-hydroxybutyrate CoA-transferase